jgi:hypothetical protein
VPWKTTPGTDRRAIADNADLTLKSQFSTWTGIFACKDGYVSTPEQKSIGGPER